MLIAVACVAWAARLPAQQPMELDPAAWGGDHVGQPLASFTSGDECLFCHRMDIGSSWARSRHGQTVRRADPEMAPLQALAKLPGAKDLAADVEFLLGHGSRTRFLKRSDEHGKLELLTGVAALAQNGDGRAREARDGPHWDRRTFGSRCAGCHATGVDAARQTFSAISLDCFVCHGEPAEKHTTEGGLVWLSRQRSDPAEVVASICGQCHLRTGVSRTTGLPYANNFVAGDNLFRDFAVDLSDAALAALNPGDRHVQENIRDVVVRGRKDVTCLSCHEIHRQSSRKHHVVPSSDICLSCHPAESKQVRMQYEVHSSTCGY